MRPSRVICWADESCSGFGGYCLDLRAYPDFASSSEK